MRSSRRLLRNVLVVLSLVGSLVAVAATSGAATKAPHYRVGNAFDGYAAEFANPTSSPPGVNVWSCVPNRSHPDPVVLLPGTLYDIAESWQALGPILADDGYCVFGLNYGPTALTTESLGRVWAVGDIAQSADQLSDFVTRVLHATGASKVDIVGWSQGGMMPRWYMRFDGGASKVHALVGLAPSNHGTTLDGAFALIDSDAALGLPAPLTLIGCPACTEQEAGSPLLAQLNLGGDTLAGVRYVVIESQDDEVVTPYTSAFLLGNDTENITLQQQCPQDTVEHLGIVYDAVALQDVVNALGADVANFQPVCSLSVPVVGSG